MYYLKYQNPLHSDGQSHRCHGKERHSPDDFDEYHRSFVPLRSERSLDWSFSTRDETKRLETEVRSNAGHCLKIQPGCHKSSDQSSL